MGGYNNTQPGIGDAYADLWLRIVDFRGTTTRRAFWLAILANIIVGVVLNVVVGVIAPGGAGKLILDLYALASGLAIFMMVVRRVRDRGISPWWALAWLVPIVGSIPILVVCALPAKRTADSWAVAK